LRNVRYVANLHARVTPQTFDWFVHVRLAQKIIILNLVASLEINDVTTGSRRGFPITLPRESEQLDPTQFDHGDLLTAARTELIQANASVCSLAVYSDWRTSVQRRQGGL